MDILKNRENMKYLILDSKDPYYNLAVEEYLFKTADDDIFMLWQNERTVVIGKNQNAYAEINTEYTERENIRIARRITGGGAVYHDLGNLNYTFISPSSVGHTLDFAGFCAPIIDALRTLGVNAVLSGRNDLELDGKKFSGNAQCTSGGRVLHHGTLLFDTDMDILSSVLLVDEEKIKSKSVRSVRARVTNLKPYLGEVGSVDVLIDRIVDFVKERYSAEELAVPQNEEISALKARNASKEWLYPECGIASAYTKSVKRRYPYGTVEIKINISGERIGDVSIQGDFFGAKDVSELERTLAGCPLAELSLKLGSINVGDFIFGMTAEELFELIK